MKNVYFDVTSDKWVVSKQINGKQKSFGRYEDVSDAQSVRDCLDNRGWTLENLFDIQEEMFGEVVSEKLLKNYNRSKCCDVM